MSFVVVISLIGILLAAEPEKPRTPSPPIREKQEEPTDQKDKSTDSQSAIAPSAPTTIIINNPPSGEQKSPPPKEPEKWPPMWTIIAGLSITGIASLVALYTVSSVKAQAQAAIVQAEAAKDAAKAAQETNKTTAAQVALMAESERPWLMFRPERPNLWGHPPIFMNAAPPFTVEWCIINVGRSPAFLTKLVPEITIIPITATPPTPPEGAFFKLILSPQSPPGDRHGSNSVLMLTEEQFFNLHNGQFCVWLYGVAEYTDTMKKPHTTKFCCRWFVENGNWNCDPVGPEGWTEYT